MKRALAVFLLVSSLHIGCVYGQQNNARLDAVKNYVLEKDYPEVFGKDQYKTRIEGVLDVDVDNDGSPEIVVLYSPHYRQSATVLIYKIDANLKVTRVAEGLAPGPLQKVSGDYLDAHNLGMAVDFEIPGGDAKPEALLKIAATSGMNGLVVYDLFSHMDGRSGSPSFLDMRGVEIPSKKHDCASFEFSKVKQIAVGHLREDSSQNYLAAWVGDEIYVYSIHGVSPDGLINKKLWVIKAPPGFGGFDQNHGLTYKTETTTAVLTLK